MPYADSLAGTSLRLVASGAVALAAFALAIACSQQPVSPPFSPDDFGATSEDLPPLAGPDRDGIELEIIVFTSPTPAPPGEPRFGGSLRVAWTGPVIRLDPVITDFYTFASEYHSASVGSHLFESLFRWDENGAAQPSLVENWSMSADGLQFSFSLRRGITFHDSSPVTSEDARLSLDRWKSTGSTQASLVRKFTPSSWLQTPDENTLVASLQQPLPSFIDLLSQPNLTPYVMPRTHALRQPRRSVKELVGTGPYAFTAWRPGESVTVERFRDYVARPEPASGYSGEQTAWIEHISWVDINDPDLQIAALLAGDVDVVDGADLSAYGRLSDEPSIRVLRGLPGNRSLVYLSPASSVFREPRARLAAQAAIDVAAAMGAMGDSELWSLCPAVYWCDGPLDVRDGEDLYGGSGPGRAGDLLAGSNYGGETVIVLGASDFAWTAPLVQVVADALRSAGFEVESTATDYLTYGGLLRRTGNYTALIGWYGHWGGGSPLTDPTLGSAGRLVAEHEQLIELRNRYALEPDSARRLEIVRDINRLRFELATSVLLGTFDHILPTTRDLKGVGLFALPYYANAWLER